MGFVGCCEGFGFSSVEVGAMPGRVGAAEQRRMRVDSGFNKILWAP